MKNKLLLTIGTTTILALIVPSLIELQKGIGKDIVSTIYSLSCILFSIGMGVICTFNPNGIKNPAIFQRVKRNIVTVRNSFLIYFTLATVAFLLSQTIERQYSVFSGISIAFEPLIFSLFFSLVSIIYFIINFLTIQRLIFDIAERIIKENL